MIKKIGSYYSMMSRKNRAKVFDKYFPNSENIKILDLGGGDGTLIASTAPKCKNIYVADISTKDLLRAEKRYGYKTIQLDETGILPFEKGAFDVIFCSSVIEHVTVDKNMMYNFKTNKSFKEAAFRRQQLFANEIRSKCDNYFVQTPYKYFFIESHTWLPGIIVFCPRMLQINIINFFNKFWPKKTEPDWNLLTKKEMQKLFPEANIISEKSFFMTKSLVAVHSLKQ